METYFNILVYIENITNMKKKTLKYLNMKFYHNWISGLALIATQTDRQSNFRIYNIGMD